MAKHATGFTVIELVFVITILGFASIVFFTQKHSIEIISSNDTKKTSINAIYYSLEEVFYPANQYYPRSVNSDVLKSVDPAVFTDPNGIIINATGSSYTYLPTNCIDDKCKSYTLKATLENENDFIKSNRNK